MRYLDRAVWVLALVVCATTFVSFIRTDLWWVRIFDFPRMQLLVLGICALVFLLFRSDRGSLRSRVGPGVLVVAIAIQG